MSRKTFCHPYVGRGRATLAIRSNDSYLAMGVSWCSPRDQFSRSKGRKIASDRLNTPWSELKEERQATGNTHGFYLTAERNRELKPDQQACKMLEGLIEEKKVPRWAQKHKPSMRMEALH